MSEKENNQEGNYSVSLSAFVRIECPFKEGLTDNLCVPGSILECNECEWAQQPVIYSTSSTDSWQLCPKCDGNGYVFEEGTIGEGTTSSLTKPCPLCDGRMIINKETGLPPRNISIKE